MLLLSLVCSTTVMASDRISWPVRTGPTLDGHVAAEDAAGLPTEWSEEPRSHIAWKLPLEGLGHSVPIAGRGQIWLTSATKDGTQQFVSCIDQANGKVLHHKLLFENSEPEPLGNPINTYASPSCALEVDAIRDPRRQGVRHHDVLRVAAVRHDAITD